MTRGRRKTAIGVVISDAMDKTITVATQRHVLHPRYKKTIKATTRYKAHDENNEARVGARVCIAATRPLSKSKRWRLIEILEQGPEE